jgi:uncharacterized membrane protein YqjE
MTNDAGRESIVGLVRELVRGVIGLVRTEITSARQEVGEGVSRLGRGAVFLGLAFVFALLFLISLVVLLIAVVALWLPWWLSALIFVVVFVLLVGLFAWAGVRRLISAKDRFTLPETRASVQEDVAWAKRLLKRE